MSFRLGLTGSIGMGKSTTAGLFAKHGCAVWDADQSVHRLYDLGGAAVDPIGRVFPSAIVNQAVDRSILRDLIQKDPNALSKIETIVHPLVQADRQLFCDSSSADVVVLDIPLLFETGAEKEMDAIVCVYVDPETQRHRVLARGTMDEAQFQQILSKQLPIAEKLARSDFQIETDTLKHAEAQVTDVLRLIRAGIDNA